MPLETDRCTRADFNFILENQVAFWGSDRARNNHHPMLIEEFGDTAFVVRDGAAIAGYLFGFFAQTAPAFYIHLVAVHDGYRGSGVGRLLYDHVAQFAGECGMTELRALTVLENTQSIAFHRAMGFDQTGEAERDGVRYVPDYAGPGLDRVVMRKRLTM